MDKIQYCMLKLEEWGGGKLKDMGLKFKHSKVMLKKLKSRRDDYGTRKYNEERDKYIRLLEKREIFWSQRAKQFWLKQGDQNSRFFHNFATGRKKHNQLKGLRNNEREWKEEAKDMQDIMVDYFERLFKSTTTTEVLTEREIVPHLTEEQNRYLIQPIVQKEVKAAIFSMHPEKSQGEDGLNPALYQMY